MKRSRRDQLINDINSVINVLGYDCLEVEWEQVEQTLRIYIERIDAVLVSVDDCAAVDRALDEASILDAMCDGEFYLEVSSPGLDRPLRTANHFRKVLGSEVSAKLIAAIDDRKAGRGRLVSVDEQGKIQVETTRGIWSFTADDIEDARLIYRDQKGKKHRSHVGLSQ
jgi:ribosome maturation factor RimP